MNTNSGYVKYRIIDFNGKKDYSIIEVNSEFENIFGISGLNVIGKGLDSLLKENPINNKLSILVDTLNTHPQYITSPISYNIYEIHLVNIDSDIKVIIFKEFFQAEHNLFDSDNKFKIIAEFSPAAIFIYQNDFIVYANPSTEVLTEYPKDELLKIKFWDFAHNDYKKIVRERGLKRQIGQDEIARYELKIVTKSGKIKWIDFSGNVTQYRGQVAAIGVAYDITEKKRVEEALIKSEEKYRQLIELAVDGILIGDIDGNIIGANNKVLEMFGKTYDEINNKHISYLFDADVLNNTPLLFSELKKGKCVCSERNIKNSKNEELIIEMHSRMMPDGSYHSFIRDITDRRKMEEALKQSEERFRQMSENIYDGLTIIENQKVVFVNKRLSDITGYSEDELHNLRGLSLAAPFEKERIQKLITRIYTNKEYLSELEYWITTKNGEFKCLNNRYSYCNKDSEIRYVVTTDITERKKLEEELNIIKESVENSSDAIGMSTPNGKHYYQNYEFDNLFGKIGEYPPDELYVDKQLGKKIFNELISGGRWSGEVKMYANDKSILDIYLRAYASMNEQGKVNALVGLHTNITERKKIEAEIIKKTKEIENQNEDYRKLTEDLQASIKDAQENQQLKSAFLANMSHEIRTPINAVIGFSNLLKHQLGDKDVETKKYIDLIIQGGSHLNNVINDIIDISKIETGQLQLNLSDFNIYDVVADVFSFFYEQFYQKGISFSYKFEINPSDYFIKSDETKLKQVLTNLLGNALKFTEKGKVEFACIRDNDFLKWYVKDTGIGIEASYHSKIFERFTQVDLPNNRKYGGTGLGLSISKSLIKLMNGTIWLDSELNKGTTFYFNIPYHKSDSIINKKLMNNHNLSNTDFSGYNILVAEDESIGHLLISEILSQTNITIIQAYNGQDAIDIVKSNNNINIILLDLGMPLVNGFDAAIEIKKNSPELPIIACTAYAFAGDKEKAFKAGCDDYITKPFQEDLLIKVIAKYLFNK